MVKLAKSVCLIGVVVPSFMLGCGNAPGTEEPSGQVDTNQEPVTITRYVPGPDGEPAIDQQVEVPRLAVMQAFADRKEFERQVRAGVSAETLSVKSGVTNCYLPGQPAGWACVPCQWTDLWIYDHENLTGNKMICIQPFTDQEGGMWFTHYHLSYGFPCDTIEGFAWDRCAQSAWGPINATTHIRCEPTNGSAYWQTDLAPDAQSMDLDCTPPNSRQLNARSTWVWWTEN